MFNKLSKAISNGQTRQMEEKLKTQLVRSINRAGIIVPVQELEFICSMTEAFSAVGAPYYHRTAMEVGLRPMDLTLVCSLEPVPKLTRFQAGLYCAPVIARETYGGISVGSLEEEMGAYSWRLEDQNFRELPGILRKLLVMQNSSPDGHFAADGLMLRFFTGTPVEKYIDLGRLKQDYYHAYIFSQTGKHTDLTVGEAYNLLWGRAVFTPTYKAGKDPQDGMWTWLRPTARQGDRVIYVKVKRPGFDLAGKLLDLPFTSKPSEADFEVMLNALKKGCQTVVNLDSNGQPAACLITADPGSAGIKVEPLALPVLSLAPLVFGEAAKKDALHNSIKLLPNRRGKGRSL